MSDHSSVHVSRRDALKIVGAAAAVGLMTACGPTPTPTPTPVPPTATKPPAPAPTATTPPPPPPTATTPPAPAAPTPTAAPTATKAPVTVDWDIYPRGDPRRWVVSKKIEPPKKYNNLVITQNIYTGGNVYKEGETVDDNCLSRFLRKEMGVHFKPVWSGPNMGEYWPTALASGDLPECITVMPMYVYLQLFEAGMLMDIKSILESTATPLTKKKKGYPDKAWWKVLSSGGKVYGIPSAQGSRHTGEVILWVRQDWLDKVKLPVPKTLDEIAAVGKAFMKEGLSKMGLWVGNIFGTSMSAIFGAFGMVPQLWRRGSDGKLAWSSLNPAIKDGLALLAQWYKEGILDAEFLAQNDVGKYLGGNLAGMGFHAWWGPAWPLGTSVQNDPKAVWTPVGIPAGPGGKKGRYGQNYIEQCIGFKKGTDPIKVEAFINSLNWWYEIEDNNESGNSANVILFEGYDYDIKDNVAVASKWNTRRYNHGGFGMDQNRYDMFDTTAHLKLEELAKMDRKLMNPVQAWQTSDWKPMLQAVSIKVHHADIPYNIENEMYYPTPTAVAELEASLRKMEDEAFARIVTGKDPVSAFDKFVEDWKKQGGDKLTAAINAEDAKRK